jgi:hypothetical protein
MASYYFERSYLIGRNAKAVLKRRFYIALGKSCAHAHVRLYHTAVISFRFSYYYILLHYALHFKCGAHFFHFRVHNGRFFDKNSNIKSDSAHKKEIL